MILIGFSGPAGSGKDTAANTLVHHLGFNTTAFADPLKWGICEMFCLDRDVFKSRETKEAKIPGLNLSPRELAKIIGTDCVREMIGENTWIHVMAKRYQDFCASELTRLAITDIRFENEAAWIRKSGGAVIHVVRSGVSWDKTAHASEHGIAIRPDDCILTNTGSLEEFEAKAIALCEAIIGRAESGRESQLDNLHDLEKL